MARRSPEELASHLEASAARVRAKAAKAEALRTSKEAKACNRAASALMKALRLWSPKVDERYQEMADVRGILLARVTELSAVKS